MISNNNKSTPEYPLVTIVALCYNQAQYAEETLDSILAQTYPNIQLIIMDDASSDNSVEVIYNWIEKNRVDCTFVAHEENQGICRTLNEALSHSKGDYFEMVACDDLYLPKKTEIQVTLFKKLNQEYAVIFSDAGIIDENSNILYGNMIQFNGCFLHVPQDDIFNDLLKSNFIPAFSVLIRTEIFKQVGKYDEKLNYEDYDMWLRISEVKKFYFQNAITGYYRKHSSNTNKTLNLSPSRLKIIKKHLPNEAAQKKYNQIFFDLYKKNLVTSNDKKIFYKLNKGFMAFLIKMGLPYILWKKTLLLASFFKNRD